MILSDREIKERGQKEREKIRKKVPRVDGETVNRVRVEAGPKISIGQLDPLESPGSSPVPVPPIKPPR